MLYIFDWIIIIRFFSHFNLFPKNERLRRRRRPINSPIFAFAFKKIAEVLEVLKLGTGNTGPQRKQKTG